jgi:hypothetical protein
MVSVLLLASVFLYMAFAGSPVSTGEMPAQKPEVVTDVSLYAKSEDNSLTQPVSPGGNDTKIAETSKLEMFLDQREGTLKIRNKSKGYTWSSAPIGDKFEDMNKTWVSFAKSLIAIDYYDTANKIKRVSSYDEKKASFTMIKDGFKLKVPFAAGITVECQFTLDDDGLSVSLPDSGIKDSSKNRLAAVYIMPFFGSVREDRVPGYIFIPDGPGALIEFDKQKPYSGPYEGMVYGSDYGIKRKAGSESRKVPMMQVYMPVFGVVHGNRQNAFVSIIKDGDAYSKIIAYPSGATTPFNWACTAFTYRTEYFQKTDRNNGGFTTNQKDRNKFDIKLSYNFLSGEQATYAGMAVRYREYLEQTGGLSELKAEYKDIPLRIEALMAEASPSLISTTVQTMTKPKDIEDWMSRLSQKGIKNMTLSLWGYEKGGVSGHKLNTGNIEKKTGSSSDYSALFDTARSRGFDVFLSKSMLYGYKNQFNIKSGGIMNIDGNIAQETNAALPMNKDIYYQNIKNLQSCFESIREDSFYSKAGISYRDMASYIFSDYKNNAVTTRADMIKAVQSILESSANKGKTALYAPNAYAFKYSRDIFDVPVNSSQYMFAREAVPFMEIVLSGHSSMYAPFANFTIGSERDILKLVDYGVYPSYILTEKPSYLLAKTNLNTIFSSEFDNWEDSMVSAYETVNPVLKEVMGKRIIDRQVPEDGISIVIYEGNEAVVVNYRAEPYLYKGQTVEGQSAKIIEVD